MEKIAFKITKLLLEKNYIEASDFEIYQYGMLIFLEFTTSITASIFICSSLDMFIEGVIFFLIFIPLRTFLDGLHMRNFFSCFIISCITLAGILILVRLIKVPIIVSLLILLLSGFYMIAVFKKENSDDDQELNFKVLFSLILIFVVGVIFTIYSCDSLLFLIACTCLLVAVSKLIVRIRK